MDSSAFPTPREIIAKGGLWIDDSQGAPRCMLGDEPFYSRIYTFDPKPDRPWQKQLKDMYDNGVRMFSYLAPMLLGWKGEHTFDYAELDAMVDEILSLAPEGLLMPRVFLSTPEWWDEAHPEELQRFSGKEPVTPPSPPLAGTYWRYDAKCMRGISNPDMASELWKRDAGEALSCYVKHCWEKYPGHFVAFQPAYGTCGEWGIYGTYQGEQYGNYGFGAPGIREWRKFLREKYGSDAALQKAWNRSDAALDTVLPPAKQIRHRCEKGCLRTPDFAREFLDFEVFYAELKASAVAYFCGIVKKSAPIRVLAGSFGGSIVQTGSSAYISHHSLWPDLFPLFFKHKEIDFLATPHIYQDHQNGIVSQVPLRTMTRHKLFLSECDVRTHLNVPTIYTPPDAVAGISNVLYHTGYDFCQGSGWLWWYDFGNGWYLDKDLKNIITRLNEAMTGGRAGSLRTFAKVTVVYSPGSIGLTEGTSSYYRNVRWLLNNELAGIGCSYDIILDTELEDYPPSSLYIFVNQFRRDDSGRIRAFLKKNNASAVWFYAAGAVGEHDIDFARMQELTGIPVEELPGMQSPCLVRITNAKHPACAGMKLPKPTTDLSDVATTIYPPMLVVRPEPGVDVLGEIESADLPGLAYRQDGKRFDLWSSTPRLPLPLLRNLRKLAGIPADVEALPLPEGDPKFRPACDPAMRIQFFEGDGAMVLRGWHAGGARVRSQVPLTDAVEGTVFAPENGFCTIPLVHRQCRILLKK